MQVLRLKTRKRTEYVDLTRQVQEVVSTSQVMDGICYVYVPHTTAGVTINEHADPDVAADMEDAFDRLVLKKAAYRHAEGNSDSHIKATMTGISQMIFVEAGKLALGRWQGIFFCEYDGPRERKFYVKVVGGAR
jgi:secondary thiamine-phosphate synthase enzyme